ncbi:phage major capsid protein [Sulfurovum mangrovi]|uniref:phage major capsid protein n=1 Tax=Sulfurovum mangrovi TaxID=2893889 RepID=UPI001E4A61AD|nr:phage major capsid protein [Sulfurovum mangrovi]UFH59830.1 phage major capsid protein [Sulfurovum mangrovi]UFH59881.1 phage major capsid protein [Sulfurovum mangrovi]
MNEHLKKLLAQRTAKQEAMQALLDTASTEERGLTKEEGDQYDTLEREFDNITKDIERTKKQIEREEQLDKPQRKPLGGGSDRTDEGTEEQREELYQRAFWKAQKREPLTAEETRALTEGAADKGGYLVPTNFATTIIEKLAEKSYMRPIATVSSSTSTEKIPVEGDDGANGWIDESGTYPESDPTIGQVSLAAYKTGRILKVSEEVMEDSIPAIEGYVAMKFTKSTTSAEEAAFVSGDGTGKPTGFLVTATLGKTAASATALTADEIIDLEYSVDEDYAQNGKWMMNRNTLKVIRKMKDSNGDYLWSKGFGGEPDTLDGKPIVVNKHMPDIGASASPIAFGDFRYYHIKDRLVMDIKRLDEKYADTGHIGFRVTKRVDGKLVLADAVKKLTMAAV